MTNVSLCYMPDASDEEGNQTNVFTSNESAFNESLNMIPNETNASEGAESTPTPKPTELDIPERMQKQNRALKLNKLENREWTNTVHKAILGAGAAAVPPKWEKEDLLSPGFFTSQNVLLKTSAMYFACSGRGASAEYDN